MDRPLSPNEAVWKLKQAFEQRIAQDVKSLIESKHLYQSKLLEYEDLLSATLQRVMEYRASVEPEFQKLIQANWHPIDNADWKENRPGFPVEDATPPIRFQPQDVKLFCQPCEGIEAFNNISSEDFLRRGPPSRPFDSSGQTVQLFVFSFLCQSCKAIPEVFLVRRQGLKLTNSGRSPIEHIDVPAAIHKSVRRFYSGAVVAYQSGQTLAGIFLLRTLIEQWTRHAVARPDLLADEALDAYMRTLPEDFKARFPSLPSLYADLSADMHAALGDKDLFEKACAAITKHFAARRLFEL